MADRTDLLARADEFPTGGYASYQSACRLTADLAAALRAVIADNETQRRQLDDLRTAVDALGPPPVGINDSLAVMAKLPDVVTAARALLDAADTDSEGDET